MVLVIVKQYMEKFRFLHENYIGEKHVFDVIWNHDKNI